MTANGALGPIAPLLAFHLRVGVRVALRAAAPVMAIPVAAVGLSPEPARWPADMGRALLLPRVDPVVPLAALGASLALAAWAFRAMGLSPGSWLRHLPAGESAHRRAGILGLAVAQLPLGLALAMIWMGPLLAGEDLPAVIPAAWCAASLAAGAAVWALRASPWLAPVAAAGAFAGFGGTAWGGALALLAVAAVDTLGGPLGRRGAGAVVSRDAATRWPLELAITVRALGWRLLAAQAAPLALLALTLLAAANNAASSGVAAMVTRLGLTVALALLAAGLAHLVAVHRPPWPWSRSLPRSAGERVLMDGIVMASSGLPLVVIAAWWDPRSAAGAALLLPAISLLAVREIRCGGGSRSLIPARVFAGGLLLALIHALLPWSPVAAALLLPILFREAARRERGARVTRWNEAGYLAEGDPLSWSGG